MVTVDFGFASATIDRYIWISAHEQLEALLNSFLPSLPVSGSDPDPDYTAALIAIRYIGGRITKHRKPMGAIEGRIY